MHPSVWRGSASPGSNKVRAVGGWMATGGRVEWPQTVRNHQKLFMNERDSLRRKGHKVHSGKPLGALLHILRDPQAHRLEQMEVVKTSLVGLYYRLRRGDWADLDARTQASRFQQELGKIIHRLEQSQIQIANRN